MNTEKKFGVPQVGYTPMESARMRVNMFMGMGKQNKNRSLTLRVIIVLFSLISLIIPGASLAYFSISSVIYESNDLLTNIVMILLVLPLATIWLLLGLKIIYSNIKK